MRILGLTSDYVRHDSSLCLVEDGEILFAAPEERFSGLKHDPRAPLGALGYALNEFDLTLGDIDAIALGMPKFRVTKGFFECGPADLFRALGPLAARYPSTLLRYLRDRMKDFRDKKVGFEWLPREKVHYISHYRAHAASAYRTSGFEDALSVVLDAAGADETGRPWSGAVFIGCGGELELAETISRYASLGCFYNSVTQAVGFRPVGEDWKLMGLAAYGDPEPGYGEMDRLVPRFREGRWITNRFSVEAKLIDRPLFLRATGLWRHLSSLVDRLGDKNVAASAQRVLEDRLMEYFLYLRQRYGFKKLALAGGVFHNIKFCLRLARDLPDLDIYVQPAAGDVGTSMGAALELDHHLSGWRTVLPQGSVALGAGYKEADLEAELVRFKDLVSFSEPDDIFTEAAGLLARGKVLGLFQGRAEWGPRALGQRSVVADPRNPDMRDRINRFLKNREWFMPFAPSVLEEDGPRYFEGYFYAPYMTHAFRATEEGNRDLASTVHLDGTVRPQIVRGSVLPRYHALISAFKDRTGVGGVLNTSFNRHGLPMVNDPKDAILHLLWGCVDALILEDRLVLRRGDPIPYKKRIDWSTDQLINKWEPFDQRLEALREKRDREGGAAG